MKNFYFCHICLKPIDLEISKLNFRVQSISLVVVNLIFPCQIERSECGHRKT